MNRVLPCLSVRICGIVHPKRVFAEGIQFSSTTAVSPRVCCSLVAEPCDRHRVKTMMSEAKDEKRKLPDNKDGPEYQYVLTNKKKVDDFKDRFGL